MPNQGSYCANARLSTGKEAPVTRKNLAYMISIALLAILLAAVLLFSDLVSWHLKV
jgi:hypothetical protein